MFVVVDILTFAEVAELPVQLQSKYPFVEFVSICRIIVLFFYQITSLHVLLFSIMLIFGWLNIVVEFVIKDPIRLY